jgi:kinesin family protein 6/9
VIGEHQLNRESSRSHCVFTLVLALVREGGEGRAVRAAVHLVDLAGSERVSKTRSEGLLLREAGHINKSLHILEQVRRAHGLACPFRAPGGGLEAPWLRHRLVAPAKPSQEPLLRRAPRRSNPQVVLAGGERGRDHVPFRSSKLTHVLRDSIGGNCRTVLVANVWGDAAQLEETLSTCRWGVVGGSFAGCAPAGVGCLCVRAWMSRTRDITDGSLQVNSRRQPYTPSPRSHAGLRLAWRA